MLPRSARSMTLRVGLHKNRAVSAHVPHAPVRACCCDCAQIALARDAASRITPHGTATIPNQCRHRTDRRCWCIAIRLDAWRIVRCTDLACSSAPLAEFLHPRAACLRPVNHSTTAATRRARPLGLQLDHLRHRTKRWICTATRRLRFWFHPFLSGAGFRPSPTAFCFTHSRTSVHVWHHSQGNPSPSQ